MNKSDYEYFKPKPKGTPRRRNRQQLLDPRLRPNNMPKQLGIRKELPKLSRTNLV